MSTKKYLHTPDVVAEMDANELDLCFALGEDNVVFGFSPESLRAACDADKATCVLLKGKLALRAARATDDNAEMLDRPGYLVPMTDRVFIKKLSKLANECFAGTAWPEDPDEVGYAAHVAAREQRLALRRKPVEKVVAELVEGVTMPKTAEPDGEPDDTLTAGDPVYLQAQMYNGQLNVSLLLCGSMLLSAGRHKRIHYTPKNPLVITRISGIKAGTTTVKYIGEELRIGDVETWVNCIRLGSKLPLGTPVHLKEGEMRKAMRRTDGTRNYKALRDQIARLQNAKLVIETTHAGLISSIAEALPEDTEVQNATKTGKLGITVSLLGDSSTSTPTQKGAHSVHIPPNVRALLGRGLSAWFREDAYYGLTNPTARRLYLLYGRHVSPRPFTLDELRDYIGLRFARESDLLESINEAHAEMFAKGYLTGETPPEYSTHYPDGGGLKRGGEKAFAIFLARAKAPALALEQVAA